MIIGIFGKSGSGKSTVSKYLQEKGFYYIDADKLGHIILKKGNEGYQKVIEVFGTSFLDEEGEINRKMLGKYVFENKKADIMSKISHPIIDRMVENEIKKSKNTHTNTVIDGALLCNTRIKDMCDLMILIKSPYCVERIQNRDGITAELAQNRLNSQNISDEADIIIENDGTLEELYRKADEILERKYKK